MLSNVRQQKSVIVRKASYSSRYLMSTEISTLSIHRDTVSVNSTAILSVSPSCLVAEGRDATDDEREDAHRAVQAIMDGRLTVAKPLTSSTSPSGMSAAALPPLRSGDSPAPRPPRARPSLANLRAHHASRIEEVAEECGAQVIWLASYSPDFSPIELMWSKIKASLRAAKARTREELERALVSALELVTGTDCLGWFKHCGYQVASNRN